MRESCPERKSRQTGPRGFSLIELLVSIGVIAVLIAIVLPALLGARTRAEAIVTFSNLRQLAMTMDSYTEAYGAYPWAPPDSWFRVGPPGDDGVMVRPGYWDLDIYWAALMHDIAPWREHFRTWIGPGVVEDEERPWRRSPGAGLVSYALCHPFFARPQVWMPGTTEHDDLWKPVRPHEVRFPSTKAMMWDREASHLPADADRDRRAILFVDGHAGEHHLSRATPPPFIPFKPGTRAVQDTPEGIYGRDY